ncbi:MAG: hypothetical protein KAH13_05165 [Tenericutes bacterium]|nr:hypothetical protein [Mycoplasmatota bacterium]
MKTSVKNIIRFDYLAKILSIVALVATLLLIAILAADETSVLGIIIPVVIVLVGLVAYRTMVMKKVLDRVKDNKVIGKVTGTRRNNGNFYISFTYEFKGDSYNNRAILLIGPLLKIKLAKMETINLVVNDLNPKKVYISDLYYK